MPPKSEDSRESKHGEQTGGPRRLRVHRTLDRAAQRGLCFLPRFATLLVQSTTAPTRARQMEERYETRGAFRADGGYCRRDATLRRSADGRWTEGRVEPLHLGQEARVQRRHR